MATPTQHDIAPWRPLLNGDWGWSFEIHPMLHQRSEAGAAAAVDPGLRGSTGAWRCLIEPALNATVCGLWFLASEDLSAGFRAELSGTPGLGGFALKTADGHVLWADEGAPWSAYQPYVVEAAVEPGRIRVQMLHHDGHTLISQSDWVAVPEDQTARGGVLGVYTEKSIARFWGFCIDGQPLAGLTEDAPNRRRLTTGPDSEWATLGTGNWMWTDATHTRIRQCAAAERAWAISRGIAGAQRLWRCHVRVSPGAGGAGMLFQTDEAAKAGFNCWLGGTFGAGCLMLYRNTGQALWASAQGMWHYDTDFILEAETKGSQARVQLLSGDSGALIVESPWIDVTSEEAGRAGCLAFHTWKGNAEFWGFTDAGEMARASEAGASALGPGWVEAGGGDWAFVDAAQSVVAQRSTVESASVLTTAIQGARGEWSCQVTLGPEGGAAGLLFQADRALNEGFVAMLTPDGVRLETLAGRALWQDAEAGCQPGTAYRVEGHVETDRVRMVLLSADGATVITQSPAVYVSDKNNDRLGHLGFTTRGGPARFEAWRFE